MAKVYKSIVIKGAKNNGKSIKKRCTGVSRCVTDEL